MEAIIRDSRYNTGIHPGMESIVVDVPLPKDFFARDRFPDLKKVSFGLGFEPDGLTELKIKSASLERLICATIDLVHLELECPSLSYLVCDHNVLTELKLECPRLEFLICSSNNLTLLELGGCPSLQRLNCSHNSLRYLELEHPSLRNLHCDGNSLTLLRLVCPSLRELTCSENELTVMQLNCPVIQTIICHGNKMSEPSAGWSHFQNLRHLCVVDNPMTNLNGLEYCASLNTLRCNPTLEDAANVLKQFLPDLTVMYDWSDLDYLRIG